LPYVDGLINMTFLQLNLKSKRQLELKFCIQKHTQNFTKLS
jgi:glyoxylate carboligase